MVKSSEQEAEERFWRLYPLEKIIAGISREVFWNSNSFLKYAQLRKKGPLKQDFLSKFHTI